MATKRKAKKSSRSNNADLARSLSRAQKSSTSSSTSVMNVSQLSTSLVAFFFVNSVLVFLANLLFPASVVLGNHLMQPLAALIYSMAVLSLIDVGAMPVIEAVAAAMKMRLTDTHWMAIYWGVNAAGLWVTGHFAEMLGLGIGSWLVAIVLGLVLNVGQGMVMMRLVSKVK